MTNSNAKGKVGERELAKLLRSVLGPLSKARRGQQYEGGSDSPDIADALPGVHIECKRYKAVGLVQRAYEQAVDECGDAVPVVMLRADRKDWLVAFKVTDLPLIAEAYAATHGRPTYPIERLGDERKDGK